MSVNFLLSIIIATTAIISYRWLRRLWWMRCKFNQGQELLTIFKESIPIFIKSLLWYQVLLLSSAYEVVRESPLVGFHVLGLIVLFIIINWAATMRYSTQPYVLSLELIKAYQARRKQKAAARRNKKTARK